MVKLLLAEILFLNIMNIFDCCLPQQCSSRSCQYVPPSPVYRSYPLPSTSYSSNPAPLPPPSYQRPPSLTYSFPPPPPPPPPPPMRSAPAIQFQYPPHGEDEDIHRMDRHDMETRDYEQIDAEDEEEVPLEIENKKISDFIDEKSMTAEKVEKIHENERLTRGKTDEKEKGGDAADMVLAIMGPMTTEVVEPVIEPSTDEIERPTRKKDTEIEILSGIEEDAPFPNGTVTFHAWFFD